MIDMRRPRSIEWDETTTIHSPTKDVFRHEIALVPHKKLTAWNLVTQRMLSLANTAKPVPVRVVLVFEPFVNKHICSIVIKTFANEFAVR